VNPEQRYAFISTWVLRQEALLLSCNEEFSVENRIDSLLNTILDRYR
jgi:hypothetical protein